jgi:serine/threonine-protein kinase
VARGIADARADVYATGIVLFEMLTGTQPFTGEMPAQIAFRHVHEDVPAPSSLVPWLPEDLDVLTRLATSRDADSRPADATGMLALTRGVHRRLPAELLDRVPETASPVAEPLIQAGSYDATEVVGSPGAFTGGNADTLVGHELIPTGDMIGRGRSTGAYAVETGSPGGPGGRRAGRETSSRRFGPQSYWWSVLLVAVFVLGLGLWWANAGPGSYATVPKVTDLSAARAGSNLAAAGFTVGNDSAYDDTVAKGSVIQTRPRGGEDARKGSTVTMVVSLGPEFGTIPSVSKKSPEDAKAALDKAGFTVGDEVERFSDSVGDGLVIGTNPKAKSQAKVEDPVTLIISKGPQPIEVPDVVGKSRQEAEDILTGNKLEPKVDEQFDDRVAAGVVISQSPENGQLMPGDTVSLVVSKGPELQEVPNVIDMPIRDARRVLREAGFKVKQQGTNFLNRVYQQSPGPGEQAPRGSTVILTTV